MWKILKFRSAEEDKGKTGEHPDWIAIQETNEGIKNVRFSSGEVMDLIKLKETENDNQTPRL